MSLQDYNSVSTIPALIILGTIVHLLYDSFRNRNKVQKDSNVVTRYDLAKGLDDSINDYPIRRRGNLDIIIDD